MEVLTRTFEEELREKMIQAKKECKYNPTRFNQMLAQYGGVETARRLIASAQKTGNLSEGLSTLWSCGRLDLSMEESVCKPEYAAQPNVRAVLRRVAPYKGVPPLRCHSSYPSALCGGNCLLVQTISAAKSENPIP